MAGNVPMPLRQVVFLLALGHRFLLLRFYKGDLILVFNRCVVVSLFWWFYPQLGQGSISGGYWFACRSFFPAWDGCNFLILLLRVDLNAVLPQPSQVVTAHSAPHVASESFYLSCLYFYICSPLTLIGKGNRRPSGLLVSPQPLHAAARQTRVVLYLLFLFCGFLSGELI